jgi:hypothetical protein
MEITKEIAEKIINKRALVSEAGVPYGKVEVTHIGYTDGEGEQWNDEFIGDFAIVSLNAVTPFQLEEAVNAFIEGDYENAVNKNISIRVPVAQVGSIQKGGTGVLLMREAELVNEDTGETVTALFAKSFTPAKIEAFKAVSLADMLAKKATPQVGAEA